MKLPPNQTSNQSDTNKKVSSHLEQINHNAAGIDLGSAEHWVCVPIDRTEKNVRRFGCFTPDLIALADWLIECRVTTVAMEATGVYWIRCIPNLGAKRFGSEIGKCSTSNNCTRTQNRCQGLSMVAAITHLRLIVRLIPPRGRNLRLT